MIQKIVTSFNFITTMTETFKFHLGMHVTNIQDTIDFYERLFGASPIKIEKDYAKFELDNPGLVISFIEKPDRVNPEFGHLGFRVNNQEELNEKRAVIEKHIAIELEEENTACCYAVQNKFWVSDPDGHRWEVYHFLKDVDTKTKQVTSTCC